MTSAQLYQWIEHPETLSQESLYELRILVARYPYFQSLRLLYLKNLYLLHDVTFGAELRKAVLYVADRRVLFYLIEGDRYALRPQPAVSAGAEELDEEPGMDRTLFLIDSFLSQMPDDSSPSVGLDYSMDYTAYLLKEEEESGEGEKPMAPKLRGHELIDDFLNKEETSSAVESVSDLTAAKEDMPAPKVAVHPTELPPSEPVEEAEDEEDENEPTIAAGDLDDSYFTETLAKIYVKQHRYDKALEIIKKLSLNYPKKNAYFADQIRFLEKLIINAKSK